MNNKEPGYIRYLFYIVAILLSVTVLLTITNAKKEKNIYYDEQISASIQTQLCFDEIKKFKLESNIEMSPHDIYDCGMIGIELQNDYTEVTTTQGHLDAKLTACNPNFAALYIEFFRQAGIRKGDEVALCFSGSFPTLNIAALCACQVMDLKVCVMPSIGASSYGANYAKFTIFDMLLHLYEKGLIKYPIDYISFGGTDDTGREFRDTSKYLIFDEVTGEIINIPEEDSPYFEILKRITLSGVNFINKIDYEENINYRLEKIYEKCPNCKMMIAVGGNIMTMGVGDAAIHNNYIGLYIPNKSRSLGLKENEIGLVQKFVEQGKPIIQMLNIKGICLDYDIKYSPDTIPSIGDGEMYYQTTYNFTLAIIVLVVTFGLGVVYLIYRIKNKKHNI